MPASQVPQHNLPLQPSSLIGRDQELVELSATLNQARVLTLTGVGGVGKTRLALAVAERASESFADGTWLVELAPLADAAFVAQTVAAVVGVPLSPQADPVSALVNYFRTRQTLLVLDNCEHLLAGCATLSDALLRHWTQVEILATSREPLGVAGELLWRVPSLAVPTNEPL